MRTNIRLIFANAFYAAVASLSACAREQPSPDNGHLSASNVQCDAPGVNVALRDALCRGDASDIRKELFRYDRVNDEIPPERILAVLKRLWDGDKSYGKGLPWSALNSIPSRMIFADFLAQGVRNSEIEAPLSDMRQFAIEVVHNAQRDVDQLEALHLLGITDAADQVPLLRSIALSDEGPDVRRRYAIEALGYICATEAAAALKEASKAVSGHDSELAKRIETAQKFRQSISDSWCQHAPQ